MPNFRCVFGASVFNMCVWGKFSCCHASTYLDTPQPSFFWLS